MNLRYLGEGDLSVNPGSGNYPELFLGAETYDKLSPVQFSAQIEKEKKAFAIPESLSNARSGFAQQTFLGASVRNFSINAGYGDSASTMSIELVEDEFNTSDKTPLGTGVDVYHNGERDIFNPPFTGSPVFFNFGKSRVSINDSYKKMYDDIYGMDYASDTYASGQFHLNFGGILQSFVQNRGPGGNPLYSAQVVDPREILSNVVLILNNYAGTTYNNKNMFNIYGFLEYNPTEILKNQFKKHYQFRDELRKVVNNDGTYNFLGYDTYSAINPSIVANNDFSIYFQAFKYTTGLPIRFPITGTGFSRRGPQGIPYYRVRQALNALLGIDGDLPNEYIQAGFGGYVNFRGYNYLLDLSGLKTVPDYYFFDFDQINLLDFCLEICDITSSDLFVSLLPIIDHPVCKRYYDYNLKQIRKRNYKDLISGIIRVDAIDRSFQPEYGAIKKYIDLLSSAKIGIQNQDLGYELSNIVTDKFVTGAQEVDLYFFSSNADRDTVEVKKQQAGVLNQASSLLGNQWTLEQSLEQQILPFYGFLDKNVVSIPKGFGSYQQILIDSSSWEVNGVGNYYIATEMELRASLISFEKWSEFLIRYNDLYMESVEANDAIEGAALQGTLPGNAPAFLPSISRNFAVTVPRSVFTSDNNSFGADGLPVNVCNPPYGYPLYYKRATRLGVQGAGLTDIQANTTRILTNLAELKGKLDQGTAQFKAFANTQLQEFRDMIPSNPTDYDIQYYNFVQNLMDNVQDEEDAIGLIDSFANGIAPIVKIQDRLSRKTLENALKVYNYVKNIADENLGKKFLVKIPREVNVSYSNEIKLKQHVTADMLIGSPQFGALRPNNNLFIGEYSNGPFGFRPRSINYDPSYESSIVFNTTLKLMSDFVGYNTNMMKGFLSRKIPNPEYFQGALNVNFNPILDQHEFNYMPDKQGGYVNFDLLSNITAQKQNLAISQALIPQDMTNFINENSRISAYVRYDNSQDLSFDLISKDSFSQQVIVAGHFIPDVSDVLDNTKTEENKFQRFVNAEQVSSEPKRPKTTAFVKCDVDESLYLVPPTFVSPINVYGVGVRDIGAYSIPRKIKNTDTCEFESAFRYYQPHFVPTSKFNPGGAIRLDFVRNLNGKIITQKEYLDTEHVYALITLPGRVIPIQDSRFRDGLFQQKNGQYIKHFLTMDVVKIPEFRSPAYLGNPDTTILRDFRNSLDPTAVGNAVQAFQKALDKLDFAFPNLIDFTMPSPVYPDLVALPLQSRERCYGPWVSSNVDVKAASISNIGGKIEFIKDENLAPWNFNGYDLMNQAGVMQAEFSNSLLLSSERGGIVFADAPSGISIGKFLQNAGPLVTNISVDISPNSIQTTFKMDLYTASFGKLQKQKQDMVSNISRERQKIKDERNALIRKGLGKNQKNINYNIVYEQIKSLRITPQQDTGGFAPLNTIVGQATPTNTNSAIPQSFTDGMFGAGSSVDVGDRNNYSASFSDLNKTLAHASNFPDQLALANTYYNTGASNVSDQYIVTSMDLYHPNMSHTEDSFADSRNDLYSQLDNFDNDSITYYS